MLYFDFIVSVHKNGCKKRLENGIWGSQRYPFSHQKSLFGSPKGMFLQSESITFGREYKCFPFLRQYFRTLIFYFASFYVQSSNDKKRDLYVFT